MSSVAALTFLRETSVGANWCSDICCARLLFSFVFMIAFVKHKSDHGSNNSCRCYCLVNIYFVEESYEMRFLVLRGGVSDDRVLE